MSNINQLRNSRNIEDIRQTEAVARHVLLASLEGLLAQVQVRLQLGFRLRDSGLVHRLVEEEAVAVRLLQKLLRASVEVAHLEAHSLFESRESQGILGIGEQICDVVACGDVFRHWARLVKMVSFRGCENREFSHRVHEEKARMLRQRDATLSDREQHDIRVWRGHIAVDLELACHVPSLPLEVVGFLNLSLAERSGWRISGCQGGRRAPFSLYVARADTFCALFSVLSPICNAMHSLLL
ncbi:conserved hypothetical protein [Coccidioides posadasii str. Silveira]|uniref:Uncharacterized protein n=1 Tax=Coccidioides posadasii (strain RMSCC 757 / Silveira) TaxID=443226 RepID=E9CWD9_COCPS|nr:conserved hypothetical protein [Coccidioides posadasii str. Silveira]